MSFILAFLKRLIPGNPYLLAGVAVAAFTAGGWTVNKLYSAGKVRALQASIEDQKQVHAADLAGVESFYQGELKRAKGRLKVQEVIKYVPTDTGCDIAVDAVRVLDNARQGLPETSRQADTGSREPATPVAISERQLYLADADLAVRFQSCKQQVRELRLWYANLP